jgi:FKBP12-rapamycin complex-associated protein
MNTSCVGYIDCKYRDICDIVLRYKEHKDPLIRKTVMMIIPDLAQLDVDEFVASYFSSSIIYVLGQLKRERAHAFHSLGKMALVVGCQMSPYLDVIIASVKESLLAKGYHI